MLTGHTLSNSAFKLWSGQDLSELKVMTLISFNKSPFFNYCLQLEERPKRRARHPSLLFIRPRRGVNPPSCVFIRPTRRVLPPSCVLMGTGEGSALHPAYLCSQENGLSSILRAYSPRRRVHPPSWVFIRPRRRVRPPS